MTRQQPHARCVAFTIPLRTVSGLNVREHWAVRKKRVARERQEALWETHRALCGMPGWPNAPLLKPPLRIRLFRVGPRRMDDDNVQGALKAVRDGIATCLGIDDGSPLLKWEYAQRKGGRAEWAVECQITELRE